MMIEFIAFDLKLAERVLSRTQKIQLNGMLRKMGYETIKWEDFKNDKPRTDEKNYGNSKAQR